MDALSKEANLHLKLKVVKSKFNLLQTNLKVVKTNFEHAKKYFQGVNSTRNRDPKLIAERKKGASSTRNRDFFSHPKCHAPPAPPLQC